MAEQNLTLAAPTRGHSDAAPAGVEARRDSIFRGVSTAAVIATYGLIVFGGIVRVTESGLGCPDWPLCYGQIIPPLNGPTLIEYAHRLITMAVTPLILATVALAWRWYRPIRSIFLPAVAALFLLVLQIVLGGVTVLTELHDGVVSVHLGNAILLFALLLYVATQVFHVEVESVEDLSKWSAYRTLVLLATVSTFGLIVIGALVRGTGAGPACMGFPGCGDVYIPQNWLGQLHMVHRLVAIFVGVLLGAIVVQSWRLAAESSLLTRVAMTAGIVFLSQFAVGIAQVTIGLLPILRALHLALATALWGSLVILATLLRQPNMEGANA